MTILTISIPAEAEADLVARAREVLADFEQGMSDKAVLELFASRYLAKQGAKVAGAKADEAFQERGREHAVTQAQERAINSWPSI